MAAVRARREGTRLVASLRETEARYRRQRLRASVHMYSFLAAALFLPAGAAAAAETTERTEHASMSVAYGTAGNATLLLNGFPIIKSSIAGVNPYQAPLFWNGTAFRAVPTTTAMETRRACARSPAGTQPARPTRSSTAGVR